MEGMLTIGDAARALSVSIDTLRRWEREGTLRTERDARNRREGVVTAIEVSGVVALVEIQAGPHRVVSVITRDAVEELGLAPGVPAVATVKATSVMVGRA